MEIVFLKSVDSTHTYLQDCIGKNGYQNPLCIATNHQTRGKGSRDNSWEGKEGNLFFSFALDKKDLPQDLPIQSYSIYFSFLLKMVLEQFRSKAWLKWPNDFYIRDKKFGGTITNLKGKIVYCGIGINLFQVDTQYGFLDIEVDCKVLLNSYFLLLKEKLAWKQIFSKYLIEFAKSRDFETTLNNKKTSLKTAILNEDGSITINQEKVFSLR